MKKSILSFILSILFFTILLLPFTFSEEMTYVKKGTQSIYVSYTYLWLCVSIPIIFGLSFLGTCTLFEKLLKED